ncbi:MAG: hypothetical protein IH987_15805 [Planctomycetes bacterium]|nr:hypothetical protein [Planctomycetota bacterium]
MPPGESTGKSGLPMPPDDATGKLRLSMPPGEPTSKSGLSMLPGEPTGKSRLPMPPGVGRLRERLEDYRRRRAKQAGWARRFVPTGLAALDAALPHGGLPCGAVTEILADDVGVGSMTLALRIAGRCVGMVGDDRVLGTGLDDSTGKLRLPMPPGKISPTGAAGPSAPGPARADQDDRRYLVVVDTGNDFYPPAARQHGIELDRLIVVRVRRREEAFWVVDQALRCRAVAVVIAALPQLDDRQSRRLQLAAESTGGIGLILRSARRRTKSFAAVRMRVEGVSCTGSGAAGSGVPERVSSERSRRLEHFPFCRAGYVALRDTSNGEKPRGLKPAARSTETENAPKPAAQVALRNSRDQWHSDDPTGKLRLPMPPGKTSPKGATGGLSGGATGGLSARAYRNDRDVYYCRIELMTVREGKPVEPILVDLHHETGDVSLHAVPVDRPVAGTG